MASGIWLAWVSRRYGPCRAIADAVRDPMMRSLLLLILNSTSAPRSDPSRDEARGDLRPRSFLAKVLLSLPAERPSRRPR